MGSLVELYANHVTAAGVLTNRIAGLRQWAGLVFSAANWREVKLWRPEGPEIEQELHKREGGNAILDRGQIPLKDNDKLRCGAVETIIIKIIF